MSQQHSTFNVATTFDIATTFPAIVQTVLNDENRLFSSRFLYNPNCRTTSVCCINIAPHQKFDLHYFCSDLWVFQPRQRFNRNSAASEVQIAAAFGSVPPFRLSEYAHFHMRLPKNAQLQRRGVKPPHGSVRASRLSEDVHFPVFRPKMRSFRRSISSHFRLRVCSGHAGVRATAQPEFCCEKFSESVLTRGSRPDSFSAARLQHIWSCTASCTARCIAICAATSVAVRFWSGNESVLRRDLRSCAIYFQSLSFNRKMPQIMRALGWWGLLIADWGLFIAASVSISFSDWKSVCTCLTCFTSGCDTKLWRWQLDGILSCASSQSAPIYTSTHGLILNPVQAELLDRKGLGT